MFPQAIPEPVRALVPHLAPLASELRFYLAGGTAAALQLGHRESVDLDVFSPNDFDLDAVARRLAQVGPVQVTRTAPGTLHVLLGPVRVTFLHYPYPCIAPLVPFEGLPLANLRDISLMKIMAISHRGARKDFIDLFAISTRVWPLFEALRSLPKKFPARYSLVHILRSLQYFEDAEREPMPKLHDRTITWPQVKSFFQEQVRTYMQEIRARGDVLDR